jgi:polyisoprenoid-binding protein YceI
MKYVYTVDPNHTTIGFSARHLMVTTIRGKFHEWRGQVEAEDDNPLIAVATLTIKAASIDSGNEMRDNDLRTNILNVKNHPEITYRSTRVEQVDERRYRVTGELTIAGTTNPITLDAEIEDAFLDMMGMHRVGFSLRGTLRRSDWQLTWNPVLEGGRLVISEEAKIEIDGALVREADKPAEAAATA